MNKKENKQHALEHGYDLICDGKYTFELEREWSSILGIVPDDYRVAWIDNRTMKQMEDDNNIQEICLEYQGDNK